jgi:ketosteroid isomerase-like protein
MPTLLLAAMLAASIPTPARTGLPPEHELYRAVVALDQALFEAYNHCQLDKFAALLDEGVEFYHDQGGVTLGRQALTDAVRRNICGRVRRTALPETFEVHAMQGFGALHRGVHRFHPSKDGAPAEGEAQFVHLWRRNGDAWTVTRIISYDHRSLEDAPRP